MVRGGGDLPMRRDDQHVPGMLGG
ncbi:hypothetical protein A2U01_0050964, partial [Trifolium medium]|nr:hypothetical protein [Trifolium medium]